MTDVHRSLESREMAAFERGRMQGEMEAVRRVEAEGMQKQLVAPMEPVAMASPDVVEVMRLTNAQRISFVLAELCNCAQLALVIVWLTVWRGGFSWGTGTNSTVGNITEYNTGLLTFSLGIFFLVQAYTNYRVLPLRTSPWFHRAWYVLLECCAMTAFILTLVTKVQTPFDTAFWGPQDWVFAAALAVYGLHFIYAVFRSLTPWRSGNHDESELGRDKDIHLFASPEQMRDASIGHDGLRTVYTGAPAYSHIHSAGANANVGAQVPVAPGNAPRWSETPRQHEADYFLVPRKKWAVVGFWAMGTAFLMEIAARQNVLAQGRNWPQGPGGDPYETIIEEGGSQSRLVSVFGLMVFLTLAFTTYVAMPPRTDLVKNGAPVERRNSISGHNQV